MYVYASHSTCTGGAWKPLQAPLLALHRGSLEITLTSSLQTKYACPHGGESLVPGTYYWVRKAVVILFPAYVLCCMFEVLEPPKPLIKHAWYDAVELLGGGPRVFSAADLKEEGGGRRPMLRCGGVVAPVRSCRRRGLPCCVCFSRGRCS